MFRWFPGQLDFKTEKKLRVLFAELFLLVSVQVSCNVDNRETREKNESHLLIGFVNCLQKILDRLELFLSGQRLFQQATCFGFRMPQ